MTSEKVVGEKKSGTHVLGTSSRQPESLVACKSGIFNVSS